ncbi:MAG: hypothetical protein ACR2QO_18575, partial [Acidimicrobiales bacterium]
GATQESATPPVDSLASNLRVAASIPGAIKLDRAWQRGIPKDPVLARRYVAETYGWDETLLTTIGLARPRQALAAVLRHNLDASQSEIGIGTKALVGLIFADRAANETLADNSVALAERHGVDKDVIEAVRQTSTAPNPGEALSSLSPDLSSAAIAALTMAHAIASSPAMVDEPTVHLVTSELSSPATVEVAVWVSICQLIHRLSVYYGQTN